MASPILVNQTPVDGATDVSADTPFRVGLRDADTHVDLSSLYIALFYARAVYLPALELPESDDVLNDDDEVIEVDFTIFNDAAGSTLPHNPCDQTLETVVADTVYRIERTGGAQEGFLYISDSLDGSRPVGATARFSIDTVIPGLGYGSYDYVTYTDFTGVMFGVVYWPRNTGLFLFFRDDGANKYITVAGPAEDGIGTRTSFVDAIFDWSAAAYIYKIMWDETSVKREALVLVVDPTTGAETILTTVDVTLIPAFLPSVTIGLDEAADPSQRIAMVIGTDGPTAGDSIDIYKLQLFRYGGVAIVDGNRADGASVDIVPTDSIWLRGADGRTGWLDDGLGTLTDGEDAVSVVRTSDLADSVCAVYRTEPALAGREWAFIALYQFTSDGHSGTYDTGAGFAIRDGASSIEVHFYDDFYTHDTGVLGNASGDLAADYTFAAAPVEWEGSIQVVVTGSGSRDSIRTYFGSDDETATTSTSYDPLDYPASSDTSVSMGFIRSGAFYGTFELTSFLLLSNCTFYEPADTTLPEAQGWTRTSAGTVTRAVADRLELTASAVGDYEVYSLVDSGYGEASGATWFAKLKISSRMDSSGTNTVRKAFGPVLLTAFDATAAMLYFVQTDSGTVYAFIPGADMASDLSAVIAQSERGRDISTALDVSVDTVFIMEAKPYNYIRLYVNYSSTAVIEIPWGSEGFSLPTFPTPVPLGTSVAFGMLSDESALTMEVAFARVSLGTGYDVAVHLDASETVLQNHIYGSDVDILVDFQDADP